LCAARRLSDERREGRGAGIYASTKAALHALSDAMRMELKPFNVDVVVVAPGSAPPLTRLGTHRLRERKRSDPTE
jgi:NAD(P)-dependent dehydrogenase (short-subunit alcohol dehydrogenase family)